MPDTEEVSVSYDPADDVVFDPLLEGLSICADNRRYMHAATSFEASGEQAASADLGSMVLVSDSLKAHALELAGDLQGALGVLEDIAETAKDVEYWKCYAMTRAWQGRLLTLADELDLAAACLKEASDTFLRVGDEFKAGFYNTMSKHPKFTLVP